jgi:hypothetical protein
VTLWLDIAPAALAIGTALFWLFSGSEKKSMV